MGVKKTLHNFMPAFTNELWRLDLSKLSGAKARFFKFMKLVRFTIDEFAEKRLGFQCVALSYFGALALVPMVAFIFSVTDGLGVSDKLTEFLHSTFQTYPEIIDLLEDKALNIIQTAQSGIVGAISALFFVWTIIWMMFQVERVFNNVWGIRKINRKIYKRFSFYIMMLVLIPFIMMIFGTGIVLYSNVFEYMGLDFGAFPFLKTFLSWLIFYAFASLTISAMYKWIPSVKLRYAYALKSALMTGAVFTVFQYLYLETQMFVSRLNGVYGVLAAIPLFLIWMNMSWQIIMYGAQLCRAFHDVDNYNIEEK